MFITCHLAVFIYSDYKNIFLLSIQHLYHHLFAELLHLTAVKEPSGSRRPGKVRRCSVDSVTVVEGGNPLPAALFSFTQRLRGRTSNPIFTAAVRSVGRSGLPPPT